MLARKEWELRKESHQGEGYGRRTETVKKSSNSCFADEINTDGRQGMTVLSPHPAGGRARTRFQDSGLQVQCAVHCTRLPNCYCVN